jgi:hypothetical protein
MKQIEAPIQKPKENKDTSKVSKTLNLNIWFIEINCLWILANSKF